MSRCSSSLKRRYTSAYRFPRCDDEEGEDLTFEIEDYIPPGAHRKSAREKSDRDNLSDPYVKHVIVQGTSLRCCDIPPELVELKREHLKIHRELSHYKRNK